MQVPLEPFDYPRQSWPQHADRRRLTAGKPAEPALGFVRTTNYVGVMNYMGARFIADPRR
jgi:polysaccharide deacetylase 2 family uncharacterized protein YibQ